MNRGANISHREAGGAKVAQLAQLDQILEGIHFALADEPGTFPRGKLFETNAQNAEYILPAVLGNSDVLVGGRHPHTSAS